MNHPDITFLDRLFTLFNLKVSSSVEQRWVRAWVSNTALPSNITSAVKLWRTVGGVELRKGAAGQRFKFAGGGTDREDQDRLRVRRGDLRRCAVTGGAGANFYRGHKCYRTAFIRPCERGAKLEEGAQVKFEDCLFYGFNPHTVLVAGATRAEFVNCLFVRCSNVWLPMKIKHGKKGPDHDVQGYFKQDGSEAIFKDCVAVNSRLGMVRHPDDQVEVDGIVRIGRTKLPVADHEGRSSRIRIK